MENIDAFEYCEIEEEEVYFSSIKHLRWVVLKEGKVLYRSYEVKVEQRAGGGWKAELDDEYSRTLNDLGQDGWEVVGIRSGRTLMKRRKAKKKL
jgi:hypothetical protein